MTGLGGLLGSIGQQLGQARETNPELFQAIGLGLLSGDAAGAWHAAGKFREQRLAQELQARQFDQRMAQDDRQFDRRLGQDQSQFASNLDLQRSRLSQDQAQFAETNALRKGEFGILQGKAAQERAERNKTLDWANGTNDPDVIGLANAGQFEAAFKLWASKKGVTAENFGMQVIPGVDDDGNPVALQAGDNGTLRRSTMPAGVRYVGPYETSLGKARGAAEGKAQGEENAGAAAVMAAASSIDGKITELKNAQGLSSILGPLDSRTPNLFSGATDAQARLDELKGQAFMQARQLLKGGGQITDFEGKKAEQAMARLDQAQSVEDFTRALDDFNDAVQTGARRIAERVSNSGGSAAPAGGASGSVGGLGWRLK